MPLTRSNSKTRRKETFGRILLFLGISAAALFSAIYSLASQSRSHAGYSNARRCNVVRFHTSIDRPLVSLDVACALLNVTQQAARGLIEDGSLLYAWDLARKQNSQRPLIRVLSKSISDYLERAPAPKILPAFETVLSQIFPNHSATITAYEVSRRWSCDPDHVLNLWRAGLLQISEGSECRGGRGGSPKLAFETVAAFMDGRILC